MDRMNQSFENLSRRSFVAGAAAAAGLAAAGFAGVQAFAADKAGSGKADAKAASASVDVKTSEDGKTITVVDMAGREVTIPNEVKSVATFGSVGVLNAFVECMGKGDLIVNQMPQNFTKNDRWAMQYKFAPQIADGPVLETADGVDLEATMQLNPDLCVTMTEDMAQQLSEKGLPCIVLAWGDVEDVKVAVTLMGEVLDAQDRAAEYNEYFDKMVAKAAERTGKLTDDERVKAIYGDVEGLSNPHVISEWWIETAGGISVTKEAHTKNSLEYTREDLLLWAPQVIFSSNTDLDAIRNDANIADLPAVVEDRIYAVPTVAHVWGNRTVEQPLTVMWAMNRMYPDLYADDELAQDIHDFYSEFFKYDMSDEEIDSIINYQ